MERSCLTKTVDRHQVGELISDEEMHVGATVTIDFVGPLSMKATLTRVEIVPGTYDFIEPSSQFEASRVAELRSRSDIRRKWRSGGRTYRGTRFGSEESLKAAAGRGSCVTIEPI